MRVLIAALAAATIGFGLMGDAAATSKETFSLARQTKPGGPAPAQGGGDDSCRWANDNECDDPDIGTGACQLGTDRSDCQYLRNGEADACRWANDGECDEPGLGTGACVQGSDRTDCGAVSDLRFRSDTCATAFNNVCEEPGVGNGRCEARTDRRDCVGADRPMTINDHFFGHDDRIFVRQQEYPWSLIGLLSMDSGGACTATLIGPDVLITAAHCIHGDGGRPNAAAEFRASDGQTARVTYYLIDRNFNYERFNSSDDIDQLDWALLRIDRRLGDELGYMEVFDLAGQGEARARTADLYQAGWSWDTGNERLSGNEGCRIIEVHRVGTFAHQCDTTRGDSGSPFMVRASSGRYQVVGVDSSFRSVPGRPVMNIAVSASNFDDFVDDFRAGRIGDAVGGGGSGGRGPK